ncbi:MAG: CCA tRNA nucleotidyltransferase [Bacilli bacterium]|nr:CCA tRNA nucleotidyltransferase [Bacilli bacterium]
MLKLPVQFLSLATTYKKHGFGLYLIGGTSRDLLLGIDSADFDFVTDATPDQTRTFLPDANYRFAMYGSIKVNSLGVTCDVTTLRKETGYSDHRHPSQVEFITSLEEDSWRRDFTVNAIYIDADGKIYDYHHGLEDLDAKLLRFIGDPWQRIKEDPLRIIRAERFAKRLGFNFESDTQKAIDELQGELSSLNPEKVLMERKKV